MEKVYTANQNGVQLFHMWKYNRFHANHSCISCISSVNAPILSPVLAPSVSSDVEEVKSCDVKRLTRLTLSRMKPGSDQAAVFKLIQSLIKSNKLSVTNDEVNHVVDCIFR